MKFSLKVKKTAWERQGYRCGYCGVHSHEYEYNFHAHHLRRVADGGGSGLGNCVILCEECHYETHNYGRYRQAIEFYSVDFPFFTFSE